ncbi:MAG: hypothetical protein GY757_22670 [bacterium]|nr:hypothetical protein [bacterium]
MRASRILRLIVITFPAVIFAALPLSGQTLTFENYNTDKGLTQSQVLKIYQDNDGHIRFLTMLGGSRFDGINFVNYTATDGLVEPILRDIIHIGKNYFFLGYQSLCILKAGKIKQFGKAYFKKKFNDTVLYSALYQQSFASRIQPQPLPKMCIEALPRSI